MGSSSCSECLFLQMIESMKALKKVTVNNNSTQNTGNSDSCQGIYRDSHKILVIDGSGMLAGVSDHYVDQGYTATVLSRTRSKKAFQNPDLK